MSTRTVTETVAVAEVLPPAVTITITSPPEPASTPNYALALEKLWKILETYKTWEDPLSQDLRSWAESVKALAGENVKATSAAISAIAQERLGVLAKEILVNPLDNSPLQQPVLERDWTWELWLHKECRRLFQNSPLDRKQMGVDPSPHLFGQEMLKWMHALTTSGALILRNESCEGYLPLPSSNPAQGQVALASDTVRLDAFRQFTYFRLAQAALERRQQKKLCAQMNRQLVQFDRTMVEMSKKSEEVLAVAEAHAAAHEAELQAHLDSINHTHQETIDGLNARMSAMEAQHRARLAALEQTLDATDKANSAAVDSLKVQIAALKQEHDTTVADLGRQIDASNKEHRDEVSRLGGQLQSAVRTNQEAMTSLDETHKRTVKLLNTQIKEGDERLHQTQGQLQKAEDRNEDNQKRIWDLERGLASAHQQIYALQNQDHGHDCLVM